MDEAVRDAALRELVRNFRAVPESIEIAGHKVEAGHAVVVARWTEAKTDRSRRGAVDIRRLDDTWVGSGGWSSNTTHDSAHPVWAAHGGTMHSTSGWVSDPAAAEVRLRAPAGRVESAPVSNGVGILVYDDGFHRDSVVELLDADGNILQTGPLYGRVRRGD